MKPCFGANSHFLELVGYRVPKDSGPASTYFAVLVCMHCGTEVLAEVHYPRKITDWGQR